MLAQVPAGATVCLLHFLVLRHKVGRIARSSASTLQLHFSMDLSARPQQPPAEVESGWSQPILAPERLPYAPVDASVNKVWRLPHSH